MQKCYRCNIQFSDERIRFCPYCGSPLAIDREYHAELERKEREKEAEKRKQEAWDAKVNPIMEHYRSAKARLRSYTSDSTFPYNLGMALKYPRDSYYKPINDSEVADLEKTIEVFEDMVAAIENRVNSTNFPRIKKYLADLLSKVEERFAKLDEYQRNMSGTLLIHDFTKKFLNGGKYSHISSEYYREENDYDIYGTSFNPEKVSLSSIPYKDRERYHLKADYEYSDSYDNVTVEYFRYKVYRARNYTTITWDFSYSGIKGLINRLSLSTLKLGTEIIKIYSDLNDLYDYLFPITRSYGWSGEKKDDVLKKDIQAMRYHSFQMKSDYVQEPRKFDHYYYFGRMKGTLKSRRW